MPRSRKKSRRTKTDRLSAALVVTRRGGTTLAAAGNRAAVAEVKVCRWLLEGSRRHPAMRPSSFGEAACDLQDGLVKPGPRASVEALPRLR
mmetsp:Transcript_100291/g.251446  ORF Transcript_100291/g.251446 Transcript_100291/m.251446 type:complete len:91 (+) Transcript_100291:1633-1905(+)